MASVREVYKLSNSLGMLPPLPAFARRMFCGNLLSGLIKKPLYSFMLRSSYLVVVLFLNSSLYVFRSQDNEYLHVLSTLYVQAISGRL